MALAPVWITDAGSLGVAPEGKFYRIALEAEDPDFPGDPTKVTYSLIAGALPTGVQVNTNGTIEGIPISVADVKGVPTEVAEDVTSKFAIRITDGEDRIADRTFTLVVSGQDKPVWITPEGSIGFWFDSTEMSFQFEATDSDPGDEVAISLVTGSLPLGLTLSIDGLLSGIITPLLTGSENYVFTLKVTDGKDVVMRTFEMFVYSHTSSTADRGDLTADNSNITADSITSRSPYIENPVPDLGTFRHDNYFAYKFEGIDPNGDAIQYEIVPGYGSVPPGLTLDPTTGWLVGDLEDIALTEQDYTFGVRVFKTIDPSIKSAVYLTSMHLIGNIDTEVTWVTDCDLGQLFNGEISELSIVADHAIYDLFYNLKGGSILYDDITVDSFNPVLSSNSTDYSADNDNFTADDTTTLPAAIIESTVRADEFGTVRADATGFVTAYLAGPCNKLPQGLTLKPSGNIVGQVSFKTFSLDSNTTTFDSDFETRLDVDPTTFDLTYTFTVETHFPAVEPYLVSTTKEFTILIDAASYGPHNEIYCKAVPPKEDRELIDSFLLDDTVIPPEIIYRIDDPFFASATEVIYQHAFGLTPALIDNYFAALELNHYNKNLVLGEIKTARALDADENVMYEVVYSQIIDTFVNRDGVSVPPEININYPAIDDGVPVSTVYPNSLENMRERLVDQIGQKSEILPRWMLSKQENGEILGFTTAWIIAYTVPGKSKLLQYKIEEFLGTRLNLVDFEIDRYTLDSRLSQNWESITADSTDITADNTTPLNVDGKWLLGAQTTFDRIEDLQGVTVDNDIVTADSNRELNPAPRDLPPGYIPRDPGLYGNPYETLFDGGCTRFISPVEVVDNTDSGDSYVMFPKKMIVNNEL